MTEEMTIPKQTRKPDFYYPLGGKNIKGWFTKDNFILCEFELKDGNSVKYAEKVFRDASSEDIIAERRETITWTIITALVNKYAK